MMGVDDEQFMCRLPEIKLLSNGKIHIDALELYNCDFDFESEDKDAYESQLQQSNHSIIAPSLRLVDKIDSQLDNGTAGNLQADLIISSRSI